MEAKIIMLKGEKGEPGGSTWGNISGTLSNQTDLNTVLNGKANTSALGAVAFSNDYDDLNNKPVLSTVATSGSYTDLLNKPTIPTKTSDLTNDSNFVSQSSLLDLIYPIGSYYWSSNSTNPGTIFGGTWEQIKDKFVLAVGDTYTTVNVTGGEAAHTLTKQEMPNHNHRTTNFGGYFCWGGADSQMFASGPGGYQTELKNIDTSAAGGGTAHNNMPPYITAYCFHRTA